MTEDQRVSLTLNSELSDKEIHLLGMVMSQWGRIEHTVFLQTLETFDHNDTDAETLPPGMNNIRFSAVLDLWKERVVDRSEPERARVLDQQREEILDLKPARDALVHGMWQWTPKDLSRISTIRVRNRELIEYHFSAEDLENLYFRIAKVNFNLRYPGGIEELAHERAKNAVYTSRRGLAMLSGHEIANDWGNPFRDADESE